MQIPMKKTLITFISLLFLCACNSRYEYVEIAEKTDLFGGKERVEKKKEVIYSKNDSALGSLRIRICDENGVPIEGYDSRNLFGDSVDRPVDFEKSLLLLSGKTVRLEISLSDCDLYSFIFE